MRRAAFVALLSACILSPAHAEEASIPSGGPLGASVKELLAWADEHNPELAAARHEAEAMAARVEPAGALDDPVFRMELQDIDPGNPNLSPSRVGATSYRVMQRFPLWGKRDLRRDVARSEWSQARARNLAATAEVHAQIKTAFAMYYQARRTTVLDNEILQLLRSLEKIAEARYANGLAPQQDVVRAKMEQTALSGELIALESEQHHARTRLNLALNRPPTAALVEPRELRPLPPLLDAPTLEQRALAASPLLAVQAAQVEAAEKNRRLTEKDRYPDLTLGVAPIQRGNRLDGWGAMVEFDLPLQQGRRRAREQEAASLLAAAQERRQSEVNQVVGGFRESFLALGNARRQVRLLNDTLLPQAELGFQSALAGYQAGKVDFAAVLDAQREIRKARLELLKALVEQDNRLTEIERLLGEEL